jgi:hypothetical protein
MTSQPTWRLIGSPSGSDMAYQITWKRNAVVFNFFCELNIHEINKASGTLHGDARFDELKYVIADFLEADLKKIEMTQIEEPAAIDYAASMSVPRMKVALIAQDFSSSAEKCTRYIEESKRFGSPWEIRVFNSLEDADAWGNS